MRTPKQLIDALMDEVISAVETLESDRVELENEPCLSG